MRDVFKENTFDLATNLFTSFGYFEKNESGGTTSNDTESIQIAPRDSQNIEFWRNSKFFNF